MRSRLLLHLGFTYFRTRLDAWRRGYVDSAAWDLRCHLSCGWLLVRLCIRSQLSLNNTLIFCSPPGASSPQACPVGTYLNTTGQSAPTGCLTCTPGYYCGATAIPGPTGPCAAGEMSGSAQALFVHVTVALITGYYCTGGATNAYQYATPNGSYTGVGAFDSCVVNLFGCDAGVGYSAPAYCLPGYYQPNMAQSSCLPWYYSIMDS
jgi:hypothetical protein